MTDMPKMEMLPCPWCGKCLHKGLGFWCHLDRMCVGSDIVVTDTPEAIAAWNRRPASGPLKEVIADCLSELLNKDDRTSPEEWPEMMMLTADELADYQTRAFHAAQPASPSAWLPISSGTPKDGTVILIATYSGRPFRVRWDKDYGGGRWVEADNGYPTTYAEWVFTSWTVAPPIVPLPSPPGEVEQEQATRPDDEPTAPTDR